MHSAQCVSGGECIRWRLGSVEFAAIVSRKALAAGFALVFTHSPAASASRLTNLADLQRSAILLEHIPESTCTDFKFESMQGLVIAGCSFSSDSEFSCPSVSSRALSYTRFV